MLFLVLLLLCAATVPLAGGRLAPLADLRFRGVALLAGALGVQVLILAVLDDADPTLLGAVHIGTFLAAGAFIVANRPVPGVPLIGLGGGLNATAIIANGGVMPARAGALETAGRPVAEESFRNSAAVSDPHLPWLGDTLAIPSGVPLANVFSVGDVVLVLGVLVLLHVTCDTAPGAALSRRRGRSPHRPRLRPALARERSRAEPGEGRR